MKIGFDAKRAFLNNTGLGNYSRDTIRVLSKYFKENSYYLYTTKTSNNKRLAFTNQENINIRTPKKTFDKILKSLWRTSKIKNDLKNDQIQLFHGLSHELPIGIEKTDIKTVVTIHDLIFIRYPQFFKTIDRKIYFQKFSRSCKVANRIIAVSQQTKKDIVDFFNIDEKKIDVVYQGCNKVFKEKISLEKKQIITQKYNIPKQFILYVGTIEERKNLITILKCLKELPNQKLVIIGDGKHYKQKCLEYINKNKLKKQITFLKNITIEEMASIYQSAEMLIYPSVFEGFGIPIIEALYSKTPVITSKGGCFAEAGGPESIYIDPYSVEQMKKAISKIKNNKEQNQLQIQIGFEHAQQFNDENIAKNLMKSYLSA